MSDEFASISTAEELLERARKDTGIDLIDSEAIEPLSIYVESVNKEGRVNEQGAVNLENFIHRSLCNRLRMQRDYAIHPEINNEVIKAPVFVCGSTRTGSTKTQKLLAATSDFNYLNFWQSLNPSLVTGDRNESPDERIKDADNTVAWFDEVSPNMKLTHALHTFEPEEESFTLAHSLRTPVVTGMADVPSYIQCFFSCYIRSTKEHPHPPEAQVCFEQVHRERYKGTEGLVRSTDDSAVHENV